MDEEEAPRFEDGPNTVCFTCGGFRKLSEPRAYAIQATAELTTAMSMGEWRTCHECRGSGRLAGLTPPI
ncbi:hypothetical protein [Parasphingorhabdus pacifica]